MSHLTSQPFLGCLLKYKTSTSYNTVLSRLESTLNPCGPVSPATITSLLASPTREALESSFQPYLGSHNLMQFHSFDHGQWIGRFDVGSGLGLKRIILGNPLIAIGMLERNLGTGLFVPVEILVRELSQNESGGTEISWAEPSGLVCAGSGEGLLRERAKELDEKLQALVEDVCREED